MVELVLASAGAARADTIDADSPHMTAAPASSAAAGRHCSSLQATPFHARRIAASSTLKKLQALNAAVIVFQHATDYSEEALASTLQA